MIVQDILSKKGDVVYHISPDATVFEAIKKMEDHDIGALLVMKDDHDQLEGIISDKDYRNKIILKGRTSKETLVKEIMTSKLFTVTARDSIENCMAIMTEKRIRHLPVMNDDNKVVGIISIGDTVKSIIDRQKIEISDLRHYISGSYPL